MRKRLQHDYANDFAGILNMLAIDLPQPHREYVFAPPRRWRADFAWVTHQIIVEIDGGQYMPGGGRHNTDADREKLNAAAAEGWLVFRFSPQQIKSDPYGCVDLIRDALHLRNGGRL